MCGLTLLFTFLAYIVPILGGWFVIVRTGRFNAILCGVIICGIAHVIQVVGAIPSVLQRESGNATPPFIIGLLLLALGASIFKPNVAPVILDQNRHQTAHVKTLRSGERIIVDLEATTTRTVLIFYGLINVGAFFMLVTIPFLSYILYLCLARARIRFGRIIRITCGYVLAMLGSIIASIIQWRFYEISLCGYYASNCDIGTRVSPVSILVADPQLCPQCAI